MNEEIEQVPTQEPVFTFPVKGYKILYKKDELHEVFLILEKRPTRKELSALPAFDGARILDIETVKTQATIPVSVLSTYIK